MLKEKLARIKCRQDATYSPTIFKSVIFEQPSILSRPAPYVDTRL